MEYTKDAMRKLNVREQISLNGISDHDKTRRHHSTKASKHIISSE